MALKVITAPATEPVTLAEAKLHLRVDSSAEDTLITMLIVAAREMAEMKTGRQLMTATLRVTLDQFPSQVWCNDGSGFSLPGNAILLPRSPVTAVTSIKYADSAGVLQTIDAANYAVDLDSEPVRITPASGSVWPCPIDQIGAVQINFTAGYASAAAVPSSIKQWILMLVGSGYAQRESFATRGLSVPPFLDGLLDPHTVLRA